MSDLPPQDSVKRWFVTTNHKDVGILYTITALFFLVFGGVLALLIRVQLWEPAGGPLSGFAFGQTVTAHGLVMVFFFLSPFAFGFANYVVPLQIGADDLAFPRLNAFSYWAYLLSGVLFAISFFQGGSFDGGWTLYAPLNLPAYTPSIGAATVVFALILFVIGITASTVNFLVTIHSCRADGMGLWNMPLFTWSILLTVWMMLFAFAALLAALIILGSDRVLGTVYFEAVEGGGLLWAHLFWFFGHPEVYIVFFPALGAMLEIFQTFCGRRIVGRKWVILAMILVAIQSFLVWMHHMFLTTINLEIKTLMMATTIGISLPFDLMVFALIYTMVKGRIRFTTPFLFALGALVLFILGGITGVFLGAVVLDYEFRGTYWVVAHFHYVMFGGATALFGALYYWYPKMTGRMYNEFLGRLHFAIFFIGFNLLYFPLFVAWETPRRVFHYNVDLIGWHQLATIGGLVVAASFLIMFYNLTKSLWAGEPAPDNPWDHSQTAEWAVESPPPLENWSKGMPSYREGYLNFLDPTPADGGVVEGEDAATDGGTAAAAEHASHGDHEHSHASIWPFALASSLLVLFLGLAGHGGREDGSGLYLGLFGLGVVLTLYTMLEWGLEDFYAPEMALAERWPFEGVEKTKLGTWFFLASDVVVFGAIISAFVFTRWHAGWTSWDPVPHDPLPGLVNTFVLLTSSLTVILALEYSKRGNTRGMMASLGATFVLGGTFFAIKTWEYSVLYAEGYTLSSGVRESTFYLTTGLHMFHVFLGMLIAVFLIARAYQGKYLKDHRPVENFGLYWHFVDIVWVFLFPLFYIL